jgi:hypothetical protein
MKTEMNIEMKTEMEIELNLNHKIIRVSSTKLSFFSHEHFCISNPQKIRQINIKNIGSMYQQSAITLKYY